MDSEAAENQLPISLTDRRLPKRVLNWTSATPSRRKHPYPTEGHEPYYQVFSDRIAFTPNLSIIDLLMNLGPEAKDYLKKDYVNIIE